MCNADLCLCIQSKKAINNLESPVNGGVDQALEAATIIFVDLPNMVIFF